LLLVFCFSLSLNLLLVANLYELVPEYSIYNSIPLVDGDVAIPWTSRVENAKNNTYYLEEEILKVSFLPKNNGENYSLYSINIKFYLPLQPSLNISFSMYANLSTNSHGGFISICLFNGTEIIEASYCIGRCPPEYEKNGYYYIHYQIGNLSNTWFKCVRNIWMDLVSNNISTQSLWRIIEVKVGVFSYPTRQPANRWLEVGLNRTDSFFKADTNYVDVKSTSIHLSIKFFACIVAVTFIFYSTYIAIRKYLRIM